jgi:hypothetical protein
MRRRLAGVGSPPHVTGALFAACRLGIRRCGGITAASRCRIPAAPHCPAVNDGDTELVGAHVDHPDRIVRGRTFRIDRVLQHSLDVFVGDVDAILWRLSQRDRGTDRQHRRQD